MDTLGSLVDSSLVQADTRGGEPRFSLPETIREYALERLAAGGDWVQAHDLHAAYFQALAEPSSAEPAGPGQLAWLDRLETAHDDLLAAMSWLVDQGPLEQAVHLFWVTWKLWWLRTCITAPKVTRNMRSRAIKPITSQCTREAH